MECPCELAGPLSFMAFGLAVGQNTQLSATRTWGPELGTLEPALSAIFGVRSLAKCRASVGGDTIY